MSKLLTQEHLAELIIYTDAIHDILMEYDFNRYMKHQFKKVEDHTKNIINAAFDHDSVGELDDWKLEIRKLAQELIKDNVHLKKVE